jgi:hypothetical protein
MTGPDAQRLTAALPNPAYAKAAARGPVAPSTLSAPALKLGITGGQTTLSLPRPMSLTSPSGVQGDA